MHVLSNQLYVWNACLRLLGMVAKRCQPPRRLHTMPLTRCIQCHLPAAYNATYLPTAYYNQVATYYNQVAAYRKVECRRPPI